MPIQSLITCKNLIEWDSLSKDSFGKIKECIKANTFPLKYFDYEKKLHMMCNTSNVGIGGVLLQGFNIKGKEEKILKNGESTTNGLELIVFFSFILKSLELNNSTIEKELYSTVKNLIFYRHIIGSSPHKLMILTDH
jgi:RNase H-like domain found in reverse transcriptase